MFLNLSTLASDNPMFPKDTRWGAAGADAQASRGTIAAPLQKIHVIISYETRQFLCMDDRSVVYQSVSIGRTSVLYIARPCVYYTCVFMRIIWVYSRLTVALRICTYMYVFITKYTQTKCRKRWTAYESVMHKTAMLEFLLKSTFMFARTAFQTDWWKKALGTLL